MLTYNFKEFLIFQVRKTVQGLEFSVYKNVNIKMSI